MVKLTFNLLLWLSRVLLTGSVCVLHFAEWVAE